MRHIVFGILMLCLCGLSAEAGGRKELRFGEDGTFKIVQFTDTHLCASSERRLGEAEKTFARMRGMVEAERPDLIVFTGDVVTAKPAKVMWDRLMDTLKVYDVPFVVMFGNHDPEKASRAEMSAIITGNPLSLNTLNAAKELADIEIPVIGSADGKPAAMLYCMDSNDYSKIEHVGGYGWFSREQVDWLYESCVNASQEAGAPLPSVAFFHIPLPEFSLAWSNPENSRKGRRAEAECHAKVNPGMFAAMLESGAIMGVFCGHDHDNDYAVAEHGIAMSYGRYSGDRTVYNNLRHGVRVIVLKEDAREFESWIREDDGYLADSFLFKDGKIGKLER